MKPATTIKPEAHVTIRLKDYHRGALEAHFLALDAEDRRLRFGSALRDEVVRDYVRRIDFLRDGCFAVQDDALRLVAVVHVAQAGDAAELGLSVLPAQRGLGVGQSLFRRAVNYLRNRGTRHVYVHCLSENGAMMHIARKCGMRLSFGGGESDGRLELDPATAGSQWNEWIADRQAEALQALRHQARAARLVLSVPAPTTPR